MSEKNVYMLVGDHFEWEDMKIITDKEIAIEISKKFPDYRVEIFIEFNGIYSPTYNFLKNGKVFTEV